MNRSSEIQYQDKKREDRTLMLLLILGLGMGLEAKGSADLDEHMTGVPSRGSSIPWC